MKKIFDVLVNNWRAVVWTGFYIAIVWAILRGLFGFNLFSGAQWAQMANIHLHGFAGLVFGLLILAAVPLYVATTVLTIRNKAVPIKVPLPNCFAPAPKPKEPDSPAPLVTERETLPVLPHGVPQEMREIFMRVRKNYGARQMSVFNKAPMEGISNAHINQQVAQQETAPDKDFVPMFTTQPVANTSASDETPGLPIPEDFDVDQYSDVPVFADINFDDDDENIGQEPITPDEQSELLEFLTVSGLDASRQDDLIIANGFAIAAHTDSDFWVADELDWFAAGKQKPSPIAALLKIKEKYRPVIYLGTTNIMDFDTVSATWTDAGIIVVTDRDELLKLLES